MIRIFTLEYDPIKKSFDDNALSSFLEFGVQAGKRSHAVFANLKAGLDFKQQTMFPRKRPFWQCQGLIFRGGEL